MHQTPPLFYDHEMKDILEELGYEIVEESINDYRPVYHNDVEEFTRKIYAVHRDGVVVEDASGHYDQYGAVRKVFKLLIRASLRWMVETSRLGDWSPTPYCSPSS